MENKIEKEMTLANNELIVKNTITQEDCVAVFIRADDQTDLVWSRIESGDIIISTPRDILQRNTPENIERVLLQRKNTPAN